MLTKLKFLKRLFMIRKYYSQIQKPNRIRIPIMSSGHLQSASLNVTFIVGIQLFHGIHTPLFTSRVITSVEKKKKLN